MKLRIGIDLDNTIIDYSNSFLFGAINKKFLTKNIIDKIIKKNNLNKISIKELIKTEIKKSVNGEKKWRKLQSEVYGKLIKHALINPAIYKFFTLCNHKNFTVYIVSHKTKYGHYSKKENLLRLSALKFLKNKKIINNCIDSKNVFFTDTLNDKIKKISELKLNFFIDDLKKVFDHKNFPKYTKKIHFSVNLQKKTLNWNLINKYFFEKKYENKLIHNYASILLKNKKIKVNKINGGGNSNLFKININNKNKYIGKLYPYSSVSNIIIESSAINLFDKYNIQKKSGNIFIDKNKNFALYPFINGYKQKKMNKKILNKSINFIKDIKNKSNNKFEFNASASCFSFVDIKNQIFSRLDLLKFHKKNNKKLNYFIKNKLEIEIPKIINYFEKKWPTNIEKKLKKSNQILSPSDFGLHNIILNKNNVYFIDFEYFGWDDPVKLTSDFILHPAMTLSTGQKKYWVQSLVKLFTDDTNFLFRLRNSFYLYGIIWCLILLNEFLPNKLENRNIYTLNPVKLNTIQNSQLNKSITLLKYISKNYKKVFPYEE